MMPSTGNGSLSSLLSHYDSTSASSDSSTDDDDSDEKDVNRSNASPRVSNVLSSTSDEASLSSRKRKRGRSHDRVSVTAAVESSDQSGQRQEKKTHKREKKPSKRKKKVDSHESTTSSIIPPSSPTSFIAPPLNMNLSAAINESTAHHDGRIRSFAHVEGNYATHLFIPIRITSKEEEFHSVTNEVLKQLNSVGSSSMDFSSWHRVPFQTNANPTASNCLHISLSRTFVLRQPQILPFAQQLQRLIESFVRQQKEVDGIRRISLPIIFRDWKIYHNEERTREFLAMLLYPTGTENEKETKLNTCTVDQNDQAKDNLVRSSITTFNLLHELLTRLNRFLLEWGAPTYYDPPELHATVAWQLTTNSASTISSTSAITSLPSPPILRSSTLSHGLCDRLHCTIGNRFYSYSLS